MRYLATSATVGSSAAGRARADHAAVSRPLPNPANYCRRRGRAFESATPPPRRSLSGHLIARRGRTTPVKVPFPARNRRFLKCGTSWRGPCSARTRVARKVLITDYKNTLPIFVGGENMLQWNNGGNYYCRQIIARICKMEKLMGLWRRACGYAELQLCI